MKDAIRYVVTVEAVLERVERAGREWARESSADGAKYIYTPEIEKTVQKKIEIYKQEVDYLDMKEIVKTVNGIPAINFMQLDGLPEKTKP